MEAVKRLRMLEEHSCHKYKNTGNLRLRSFPNPSVERVADRNTHYIVEGCTDQRVS